MSQPPTLLLAICAVLLPILAPGLIARPTFAAGSVVSEGDSILRADVARATFGVTGVGVKVGVISTGIQGLDEAKASGDLPVGTCGPLVGGTTTIDSSLCRGADVAVDSDPEGTAMMEIIHDLAPGAELAFCGAVTRLGMVACIDSLAEGADVIVDDKGFFAEQYFEDGIVAEAAARAVANGVVYVSATGNDAEIHYQGLYVDSGDGQGTHQIGPGNTAFTVFGDVTVFLQWSNRFGVAADDYDLCLAEESPVECAAFNRVQDGDDDPIEFGSLTCPVFCDLEVRLVSGTSQVLELFVLEGTLESADRVTADSVFGHPAASGVLAIAAIDADDPGNDRIESFSSRGPSTILFPEAETRQTPSLAAIDGVSVSGAGGFPTTFFGTSASAPHAAAVAALILEANPSRTPDQVREILQQTAVPLGSAIPNADSGFGRIDAFAAVETARAVPSVSIATNQPAYRSGERMVVTVATTSNSSVERWFLVVALVTPLNTTAEEPFFIYRFDPVVELITFQTALARGSLEELAARPAQKITAESFVILDLSLPELPAGEYQWLAALFSEDFARVSDVASAAFSFAME